MLFLGGGKMKLMTTGIYIGGTIPLSGKNKKALITFATGYIRQVDTKVCHKSQSSVS